MDYAFGAWIKPDLLRLPDVPVGCSLCSKELNEKNYMQFHLVKVLEESPCLWITFPIPSSLPRPDPVTL